MRCSGDDVGFDADVFAREGLFPGSYIGAEMSVSLAETASVLGKRLWA